MACLLAILLVFSVFIFCVVGRGNFVNENCLCVCVCVCGCDYGNSFKIVLYSAYLRFKYRGEKPQSFMACFEITAQRVKKKKIAPRYTNNRFFDVIGSYFEVE